MINSRIQSAVDAGNELLARILERTHTTRVVSFGYGTARGTGDLITVEHGDMPVVCVADETTWAIAGDAVTQSLVDAGLDEANRVILPARPRPYAAIDLVDRVRTALANSPGALPIAIGSGTINDAVKLAAAQLERPYWVVGTAPSMDGYTAAGASISKDGFKQNMPCAAPRGVVMDLNILQSAPQNMWASGFGDMIGKISALADWRVADALGVESIDPWIWDLAAQSVENALADPKGVGESSEEALPSLVVGLLISGLAIQAYNSSRPGSGAEHMFSHLWEMEHVGLDWDPPLSHGAKVGVGSHLVAAFYDELLQKDLSAIDIDALIDSWPSLEHELYLSDKRHGDSPLRGVAHSQLPVKYPSREELRLRLETVVKQWESLRDELRGLMRPADEIHHNLVQARAYHHPAQISRTRDQVVNDFLRLRTSRNRYTSFDLAAEAGVLAEIVDDLGQVSKVLGDWPASTGRSA